MFKIVPDYEFAMVNKLGEIKSSRTQNPLKTHLARGYYRVKVWDGEKLRGLSVHRAVAKAFIPNPMNLPQVNHINCNKIDNSIQNLEWCTALENTRHAIDNGLTGFRGDKSPASRYSEELIHSICRDLEIGLRDTAISDKHSVCISLMQDIKSKSCWVEVSNQYSIKSPKKNMSKGVVENICRLMVEGMSNTVIASKLKSDGVTRGIVRHIRMRKTFKHISKNYNWEL